MAVPLLAATTAVVTGCSLLPGQGAAPSAARTAVPTPDLCAKLDRALVNDAMRGKVEKCETTSKSPDEHVVRFVGKGKAPGSKRTKATITVAFRLRHEPKTGEDRWARLGSQQGDKRVKLLSVGDDAVFDYRGGEWPDLALVKDDLIILITHEGPAIRSELPGLLTPLAEAVLAQVRRPA